MVDKSVKASESVKAYDVSVDERGGEDMELREVLDKWRKTWKGSSSLLEEWVQVAGDDGIASDHRLPRETEYWDRVTGYRTKYLPPGSTVVWLQLNDAHGVTYWRHKDTMTSVYNLPPLYGPRAETKCFWLSSGGVPKIDASEKSMSKMALRGCMTREQAKEILNVRDGSRSDRRRSGFLRGLHPPEADRSGWRDVVPQPQFVMEFNGVLHGIKCCERAGGGDSALRLYRCPTCDLWVERDGLPSHGYFRPVTQRIHDTLPFDPNDFSCLIWAVTFGFDRVVEFCLELTDNRHINRKTAHGETLLHLSARAGWPSIASTLLWHGADYDKLNSDGKTPLQVVDLESPDTVKVIRSWKESQDAVLQSKDGKNAKTSGADWLTMTVDGETLHLEEDGEELDEVRMQYPTLPQTGRASIGGMASFRRKSQISGDSRRGSGASVERKRQSIINKLSHRFASQDGVLSGEDELEGKELRRGSSALSTAPGSDYQATPGSTPSPFCAALGTEKEDFRCSSPSPDARIGSSSSESMPLSSPGLRQTPPEKPIMSQSARPSSARSALKRSNTESGNRPASANPAIGGSQAEEGSDRPSRKLSVMFICDTDTPITQADKNKGSTLKALVENQNVEASRGTASEDREYETSANSDPTSRSTTPSDDPTDNGDEPTWKSVSAPRMSMMSDGSAQVGNDRRKSFQRCSWFMSGDETKDVTKNAVRSSDIFKARYSTPIQLRRQTVQKMIWDQADRNRALQYFPARLKEAMDAKQARQASSPHSKQR